MNLPALVVVAETVAVGSLARCLAITVGKPLLSSTLQRSGYNF